MLLFNQPMYSNGGYVQNQNMVDYAVRCVNEGRCVNCGQHIDGRIIRVWTESLMRIHQLEANC